METASDPSKNPIYRLRFTIGDTTEPYLLQDIEYQYIIDCYPNNETKQIAAAYRAAASAIAIHATKRSLGPQSEDDTNRLAYYSAMADSYEKKAMYSGTPPLPEYAAEKVFGKNMMANEQ